MKLHELLIIASINFSCKKVKSKADRKHKSCPTSRVKTECHATFSQITFFPNGNEMDNIWSTDNTRDNMKYRSRNLKRTTRAKPQNDGISHVRLESQTDQLHPWLHRSSISIMGRQHNQFLYLCCLSCTQESRVNTWRGCWQPQDRFLSKPSWDWLEKVNHSFCPLDYDLMLSSSLKHPFSFLLLFASR